jgi:hypothetical protein
MLFIPISNPDNLQLTLLTWHDIVHKYINLYLLTDFRLSQWLIFYFTIMTYVAAEQSALLFFIQKTLGLIEAGDPEILLSSGDKLWNSSFK